MTTLSTSVVIAIGTTNPCKIDAVRIAFEEAMQSSSYGDNSSSRCKLDLVIASYNVPSGVSHQPFGDLETKDGAMNRAKAAQELCITQHGWCDFAVGLEGGVEVSHDLCTNTSEAAASCKPTDPGETLWCMAWMAILGSDSFKCSSFCKSDQSEYYLEEGSKQLRMVWGYGKTGMFALPTKITELVRRQGLELGDADDLVFNRLNSKQGSGTVGILTNFMIHRSEYYVHALKLALIPWIWPNLYFSPP